MYRELAYWRIINGMFTKKYNYVKVVQNIEKRVDTLLNDEKIKYPQLFT